jgi:polyferredoxin
MNILVLKVSAGWLCPFTVSFDHFLLSEERNKVRDTLTDPHI